MKLNPHLTFKRDKVSESDNILVKKKNFENIFLKRQYCDITYCWEGPIKNMNSQYYCLDSYFLSSLSVTSW